MGFWGTILASIADFFRRAVDALRLAIYRKVICQHFCLYKEAGSNFKNTHVHILIAGKPPGNQNPDKYTGLGHDDSTPGMSNPTDPKHNSVSKGNDCGFRPGPGRTLYPNDLQAYTPFSAYLYPAPAEGACATGYRRVKCDCGEV